MSVALCALQSDEVLWRENVADALKTFLWKKPPIVEIWQLSLPHGWDDSRVSGRR
jgi:hypothetical protein